MVISSIEIYLKTEKYLEDVFLNEISDICLKNDIQLEYYDTGKRKFSWLLLCYQKIYLVSLIGELDKVNQTVKELYSLEKGY